MIRKEFRIGKMDIKNRLIMPPMATYKAYENGAPSEETIGYYQRMTEGGYIGLVIVEHTCVCEQGKAGKGQLGIYEEGTLDSFRHLTAAVHENGSKIALQLSHAGSYTSGEITGCGTIAASAIVNHPTFEDVPKEMTKDDIAQVRDCFAVAALRAKECGFDAVEIHSAHSYLLNQFYSPLTNKRMDEYGSQSLENRLRFHREIIASIREKTGADYPLLLRLGGCDYQEGGSTIADAAEAGKLLQEWGVDALDISGGMCRFIRKDRTEPGYFRDMSIAVKKKVNIPVILTGGVKSVRDAEELLQLGAADCIGIGRALAADREKIRAEMEESQ